uniref:Mos1 transposase HTH domain-containing protein n=1 Tax=Varanus komodoensis TaxID=61221 RepID=A0A8D2LRM9_VARKO
MTDTTMLKKMKHHAVIKFLTKQGKSQNIIHKEMVAIYQDSAPSLSTVQKWSSEFKRGRESIEDDPHSGRPVTATTKENVKKIEKLVMEDARIKIKMLAEMTNLSVGTIFTIFHDHLNLSKVCARWMPQMLMAPQKQVRVECCMEFSELCGEDPSSILTRLLLEMKLGFITMTLKVSRRPCSGIKMVLTLRRNSKSLHQPEKPWPQYFGTQREFY